MKFHVTHHAVEQFEARYPEVARARDLTGQLYVIAKTAVRTSDRTPDGCHIWRNGSVVLAVRVEGGRHATIVTVLPPSAYAEGGFDPDAEIRADEDARRAAMTDEEKKTQSDRVAVRDSEFVVAAWIRGETRAVSREQVIEAIRALKHLGVKVHRHPRLESFLAPEIHLAAPLPPPDPTTEKL